jgi:hypothetical protein
MTPPATVSHRPRTKIDRAASPEAVLLEALAAAGEALTYAIVHHDLDAIVAATRDAELLMARLTTRDAVKAAAEADAAERAAAGEAGSRAPEAEPPDPAVVLLGARIGATARRNALLLEHAWATDAALLRLLASAARSESETALGGGYARHGANRAPDPAPAGWLDRQA